MEQYVNITISLSPPLVKPDFNYYRSLILKMRCSLEEKDKIAPIIESDDFQQSVKTYIEDLLAAMLEEDEL